MLAALLGLLVSPATAAPEEGILLRGDRTGYVDLFVYANHTVGVGDVKMSTNGSYVGFFLSPAPADRDTVGALTMPRVGATGNDAASVMKLGESWDLRAGKYRAFLITDGPAEVFIPIDGQGFRGWSPVRRAPLSVRPANFDVEANSPGRAHDVPVSPDTRSLVIAAAVVSSSSLTAVESLRACVGSGSSCTPTQAVSTARVPLARVWSYGASLVPAGAYTARFAVERMGGMDAGSRVDGAVIVLTIGRQT